MTISDHFIYGSLNASTPFLLAFTASTAVLAAKFGLASRQPYTTVEFEMKPLPVALELVHQHPQPSLLELKPQDDFVVPIMLDENGEIKSECVYADPSSPS